MHLRFAMFAAFIPLLWLPAMAGLCGEIRVDARVADPSAYRQTATHPNLRAPAEVLDKGVFLVASERLSDPNFRQSVVLVLEYDSTGALGLIINRPSNVALASALPDIEGLGARTDVLYIGGPVGRTQILLLVRAAFRPEGADPVVDDVYVSGSLDTLRALLAEGGAEFHAHAGYAGWGPGQLDGEVMRGDWYVTPADAATIFEHPSDDVWPVLIKQNAGLWVRRSPIRKAYPPASLRGQHRIAGDNRPLANTAAPAAWRMPVIRPPGRGPDPPAPR